MSTQAEREQQILAIKWVDDLFYNPPCTVMAHPAPADAIRLAVLIIIIVGGACSCHSLSYHRYTSYFCLFIYSFLSLIVPVCDAALAHALLL